VKSYGWLAEFASSEALLSATRNARAKGFAGIEAYSPFPIEGLAEAMGFRANRVPLVVLLGGLAGGIGGYFMQWYSAVVSYPINSGGRPLHAWPSFIPATFELAVLGAALAGAIGMLALNGLPRLRHPLFEIAEFDLASRNRFFLCIRSDDARDFLELQKPIRIWEVPE
jgi:hypothetical protein